MLKLAELIESISEEEAHRLIHGRYNPNPPPYMPGRVNRKGTPLEETSWTFRKVIQAAILREGRDTQGVPFSQSFISRVVGVSRPAVCQLFAKLDKADDDCSRAGDDLFQVESEKIR